jgi:hypothetical protein
MSSKNAHEWQQNAENNFGLAFFRAMAQDGNDFLSHVV